MTGLIEVAGGFAGGVAVTMMFSRAVLTELARLHAKLDRIIAAVRG